MARGEPPRLRVHARGQYMVRWAGVDHYFGTDEARAREIFLDPDSDHPGCLARWMAWKARRARGGSGGGRGGAGGGRPGRMRLSALLESFLDSYSDERRETTRSYFAKHLRRFSNVFGDLFVDELDLAALLAFRRDLLRAEPGYAPKTIAHDLGAVKTMLVWGANNHPDRVPPLNLRAVRNPRLPAPNPRVLDPQQVRRFIALCEAGDARLGPWLRVQYLTLARPIEAVRLIAGAGVWEPIIVPPTPAATTEPIPTPTVIDRGLFVLDADKTERLSGIKRRLVVTAEARMWLECCRPHWSSTSSYGKRVSLMLEGHREREPWLPAGPHALRHSAASNLHRAGVERAACDLLLGHMPSRVSLTYNPVDWHALHLSASRLAV